MLTHYLKDGYDLENSFVIGDRLSDIELAKNLGAKGILINVKGQEKPIQQAINNFKAVIALETSSWEDIYNFLKVSQRYGSIERNTNETKIKIDLNLDGTGKSNIDTGIAFLITCWTKLRVMVKWT